MEKQNKYDKGPICPECGCPITDGIEKCPECGCPIARRDMNESADDDGRKSRIQSEVDTVGCVKAWENGCRSEKTTVKVFEYLCIALNIVAVALVIAAIIHLSVKWSDIHDNTLMYHVFWRNMVRY